MQPVKLHLSYYRGLRHILSRTRAHQLRGDPRVNNHVAGESRAFLKYSAGGEVLARNISNREQERCQDNLRGYLLGVEMDDVCETCLLLDAGVLII